MEQNYVTVTLFIGLSMTLCVRSVCLETRSLANAEGSREHAIYQLRLCTKNTT